MPSWVATLLAGRTKGSSLSDTVALRIALQFTVDARFTSAGSVSPLATTSAQRWQGIDILRGLSILAVVLLHIDGRIPFAKSGLGSHLPSQVNRVFFRNGYYGVKIFFVISGFLITTNILRRWGALDHVDLKAFYRLRFARIIPCLLTLLVILACLHTLHLTGFVIDPRRTSLARALFAALTFHLNWLEIQVGYLPANWDVLWSLSIEEVFYLAYPILCRFLPKWFLAILALALIAAGPFARTSWAHGNELAEDKAYLTGFDCIAIGCVSAVASHAWMLSIIQRRIIHWVGVLLLVQVSVYPLLPGLRLGQVGIDVTVLALGAALLLLALDSDAPKVVGTSPLAWFGRNSYEIYLTHGFVVIWGAQAFHAVGSSPNMAPFWHAAMVGVSGLLGWATAKYFSEPLNRRLRRPV
jgi:peptidoglycan/LPS O-acetylase OafA/YrhL